MRWPRPLTVAFSALFAAHPALAQTSASAPAGGGLPALEVKVDLATATVSANGSKIPIGLDRAKLPGEGDVRSEVLAVGLGKHVVHLRVPARDDVGGLAWEAILAAGHPAPVFAGVTGLAAGDPGERTGKALQVIPDGPFQFVVVGDTREDLQICGQRTTLLQPLALYPDSLQLRPATVQRLTGEQEASAQTLLATDVTRDAGPTEPPPLARLLAARGSSVAGSTGSELTDDDLRTLWVERRPGAGQGEFVVMDAPEEVRIPRMRITVAPPAADPAGNGATPKSFYLVSSAQTFRIVLPGSVSPKAVESYEVVFPQPLQTSCVAVILDGTSRGARGESAHPDVGLAEIVAYSEFDSKGVRLEDVAHRLSTDRGASAAQLLGRAGRAGLAAVEKAYATLDPRGRSLAIAVASTRRRCEETAPLLVRGVCDPAAEVARKAREKLARCKEIAPVLARIVREGGPDRACVAPLLSSLDPEQAFEPVVDALADMGEGDPSTRAVLRAALGEALKTAAPARLTELMGDRRRTAATRLEIMRAAKGKVRESPTESDALVAELLGGAPSMRTRYLVLGPIGELARAGARVPVARLVEAVTRDPDWPVRAHAAEMAAGIDGAQVALVTAAGDPEPRVREAAFLALVGANAPGAVEAAARAMAAGRKGEPRWTFVVLPAIAVLAAAPPEAKVDEALGGALRDRSAQVRVASLSALANRHAISFRAPIRDRLSDKDEDADVRATAARALGTLCDADSLDRLTALARALGLPGQGADEQEVALGALAGLAVLHPRDFRERIATLLAKTAPPYVRVAAEQALSGPGACP